MDISIIIVSWNVREHLKRCLASIEKARGDLSLEVFIVDNASTDGTQEWLAHNPLQLPLSLRGRVSVIQNETNRGFAAANNQAIRQAKGEYILLLNPDTELQPHLSPLLQGEEERADPLLAGEGRVRSTLELLLDFMQSHPRSGILGPKLLNTDGTLQRSVRRFPDAWSPILSSLSITPKKYLATDFDYTKAQQADQVMGACFLIRRALIEQIGLLDERFFIWFEEVDFCKRAKNAQWEVWYTPDVSVVHHGGESFAQVLIAKKQWMYTRSLLYYFWKHGQWGAYIINLMTVPFRLIIVLLRWLACF